MSDRPERTVIGAVLAPAAGVSCGLIGRQIADKLQAQAAPRPLVPNEPHRQAPPPSSGRRRPVPGRAPRPSVTGH